MHLLDQKVEDYRSLQTFSTLYKRMVNKTNTYLNPSPTMCLYSRQDSGNPQNVRALRKWPPRRQHVSLVVSSTNTPPRRATPWQNLLDLVCSLCSAQPGVCGRSACRPLWQICWATCRLRSSRTSVASPGAPVACPAAGQAGRAAEIPTHQKN